MVRPAGQPALGKNAGHAVAYLHALHTRTQLHHLARTVRTRHQRQRLPRIVLAANHQQIAEVQ
jgi:hypothetical protein